MDKIVCVGKNYLEHVQEMGGPIPERPVLFIKPPSILRAARAIGDRMQLRIPPDAGELHYECEIVVRVGVDGYRMSVDDAEDAITEVTLGLDMTLRDVQTKLKEQGHPWEVSKTFMDSAVIGPLIKLKDAPKYLDEPFMFAVDDVVKQKATGKEMTLKPAECVAYASQHFPLRAGDLIFTGTPAGVGPVRVGQVGLLSWGERFRFSVAWVPYSP
jgi:2-keto-4-pentenoate hydratase/2-oxohepta-3-ene-1,7-dioic acid hydratase in catechol pathway